ncbi:PhiH1 repressor [Halobaculum sp. CBA1158]|uniref:PhiH1 repressor n=1 Tax=Halobaculum sp. CBA1158 TaxID=2904243 RepID=UPI001F36CEED|nr:PhiH1 repressor [Halobaculum sp. CBA1158]UIO98921.1 PhiH1 repressor [Halobaculum sp. CBA1158]
MSTATAPLDNMRQAADWMVPSDDRILELVRQHGNLTPKAIEDFGGPVRQHASTRCSTLAEYGLLIRVHRGLYGITDEGRAYLDEELDANTLAPDDAE